MNATRLFQAKTTIRPGDYNHQYRLMISHSPIISMTAGGNKILQYYKKRVNPIPIRNPSPSSSFDSSNRSCQSLLACCQQWIKDMIPSLNTGIRVIQFSEDGSKLTLTWLRLKSKRSKRHAFRVISK